MPQDNRVWWATRNKATGLYTRGVNGDQPALMENRPLWIGAEEELVRVKLVEVKRKRARGDEA